MVSGGAPLSPNRFWFSRASVPSVWNRGGSHVPWYVTSGAHGRRFHSCIVLFTLDLD